jgi:hypothetical protein
MGTSISVIIWQEERFRAWGYPGDLLAVPVGSVGIEDEPDAMDLVRPERDDLFLVLRIVKISPCLELAYTNRRSQLVLAAVHNELETYPDDLDPLPVLVFSTEVGPMPGVVVVHPGSYPI